MKSRAIKDLAQLNDTEFFEEVSKGLTHVHENALRLDEGIKTLVSVENYRGARALKAIAKEEAAKYLILLDAVRCPRENKDQFSKHLGKFNNHLPKGVYVNLVGHRFSNFEEVVGLTDNLCESYYLDGPNGDDWVFRNSIEREREEAFYVDYVSSDDGHYWMTPKLYESTDNKFFYSSSATIVRLTDALHRVGMSSVEAIKLIAKVWRPIELTKDTSWKEIQKMNSKTLETMNNAKVLVQVEEKHFSTVIDSWGFPAYALPMERSGITPKSLKEVRDKRCPEI